ncbi:hypothetical protein EC973_006297 [Apophysomyces ossiformis]|uniref:Prefoldin subunit 3 n=1 Tax=Apophysomyces ossiformis TaxID=679940 RepID=A0A8H7BWH4_9FUNG|nr:hypothetical protein EC973_006297 [Apophysomyces ossiformis]
MASAKMETNPRGIPLSPFVERVEDYVSETETVEIVLKKFQEAVSKYKFMEINLLQRRKVLEEKIPEIEKTIAMINFLIEKKEEDEPIHSDFELNDTLYAQAKIEASGTVYLWLGVSVTETGKNDDDYIHIDILLDQANVMLEYTFDEAKELLESKLETAKTSLKNTIEDLEFLRSQITTMEVNTARVYNWDVKQRRLARAQATA